MARKELMRWGSGVASCVLLGALLLPLLNRENSLSADDAAKPAALPADLASIPSDAVFLASGRVADLWNSDLSKSVRRKIAKEWKKDIKEGEREFEKSFGLPIDQVERLTMVVLNANGPAEPLLFVGTTKAYDRDKVIEGKVEKYKGRTFYVKRLDWAVYPLGERVLVYGKPSDIQSLIDHPAKSDGNLAAALRLAAGKHSAVYAANVKAINDAIGARLTGEAEDFKQLLQALYGTLTLDAGAELRADVKLVFASEEDAEKAVLPARTGLGLARIRLQRVVDKLSKEKGMGQIVSWLKQFDEGLAATQVERKRKALQASVRLKGDVAYMGITLVKGVQKVRAAANRTKAMNNLKQIALAMANYADTMNVQMPAHAIYDKNGKPLLSWRVTILPFIDQQNLYNQFHLNEPWDSEHNKKLLAKMPKTYASPQDAKTLKEHTTYYQGFVGKGAFFEGKQGIRYPASITDGASNTLMIVEASKAVPWSKPEDIPYDPSKPLPKLGLPGVSYFLAAMCDGSVHIIAPGISKKTLRAAITRNNGDILGPDF